MAGARFVRRPVDARGNPADRRRRSPRRAVDAGASFLQAVIDGGTIVLRDDAPRESITGSAGELHRIDRP
jgi:hypothetical protein